MRISYRLFDATLESASALLAVEAACWNESPLSAQGVLALLRKQDDDYPQSCWLALAADTVVGFVHAFQIQSLEATTWQIDLLAVHPNWRRRGIATELLRRAILTTPADTVTGRALVAVRNVGSAKAFERVGFKSDGAAERLLARDVPSPSAKPPTLPDNAALQRLDERSWAFSQYGARLVFNEVHTLLYNGLWVAGFNAQMPTTLLDTALTFAAQHQLDELNLLLPRRDETRVQLLRSNGYEDLGDYLVWTCRLDLAK